MSQFSLLGTAASKRPNRIPSLVIVDDDQELRTILRSIVKRAGFNVIDECSDGHAAISVLSERKPTIGIVDIHLPGHNGIEVITAVHKNAPRTKLIAITGHALDEFFDGVMHAGAAAFLYKPDLVSELPQALNTVLAGERHVSRWAINRLLDRHIETTKPRYKDHRLTRQQANVVALTVQGLSNKETAAQLAIAESTVEKHRSSAMHRLGLTTFADLMHYALMTGLRKVTTP